MNCFTHRSAPAIGICKSCGKALCPDCLTEMANGLACRNSCESRVDLINRIVDLNRRVLVAANTQVRTASSFLLILGLIFLGFATWGYSSHNRLLTPFFGVFGLAFISFGLVRLYSGRFPSPSPKETLKESAESQ